MLRTPTVLWGLGSPGRALPKKPGHGLGREEKLTCGTGLRWTHAVCDTLVERRATGLRTGGHRAGSPNTQCRRRTLRPDQETAKNPDLKNRKGRGQTELLGCQGTVCVPMARAGVRMQGKAAAWNSDHH